MTTAKPLAIICIALLSLACSSTKGGEKKSGFDGSWEAIKFTTDPNTPYSTFQLQLRTSGQDLTGKYCFITQSGNKIDCDPESGQNIMGKIEIGGTTAHVIFHSYFGARNGKARIDNKDGVLSWKIESLPTGGGFYGPKFSVLHKSSKPAAGATDATDNTHCNSKERTIFSCSVSGGKIVSLCGQSSLNADSSEGLQYRFGKKGKIELNFPGLPAINEEPDFLYNHYFREKNDYYQVGFINGGHEYRIFRNYEKKSSEVTKYGVEVKSTKSELVKSIPCSTNIVDHLSDLNGKLRCDSNNALGCSPL